VKVSSSIPQSGSDAAFEVEELFCTSSPDGSRLSKSTQKRVRNPPQLRLEMTGNASQLARNQRLRLCGQAEELLQKVLSLYEIGISLDILVSDSRLQNLLTDALKSFNAQRNVEMVVALDDCE
jgi:hypothetical protein